MKHRDCKWILLILCTLFFCSACSVSDLSLLFMSKSDREIYVHDNPRFWDQTMPVPDSSNLFTLENDFFSGKPYNDLFRFGDNLLLAGEASYSSVIADHFNDGADDPYQYSFEVYSPWYNRIIATLPHTEVSCTSYQVCGDTLLLLDSESGQLLVYDSGLEPAGSYDLSFYEDIDALTFYDSGISGTYYVYSPDSEAMECLRLSETHTSHTPLSIPYYELVPLYSTPDEHTLTFSGVDASSLLDVIVVYDTEAGAVACTYPADSLDEVAADANTDFFPYGNILRRDFTLNEASSHYLAAFYYYDPDGDGISSCAYDCGDYSSTENVYYLGRNLGFFDEQQLGFLLAYNSDCQPQLLVWDLSKSQSDMQPLSISAIPDTTDDSVLDWGQLIDLRARADALEQIYGIEICFGPETPDQLGVYQLSAENDSAVLAECFDKLSASFKCYPANFFSQLCMGESTGITFYLAGSIYGDTEGMLDTPTGFTDSIDQRLVMILSTQYRWDWDYTINHELSHLIDQRLEYRSNYVADALFSESKWSSFNPDGCEYLNTYDGYEESEMYELYSDYFADAYGLTFATEDRAELFGLAMADYLGSFDEDAFFKEDSPTAEKFRYYCACIRDGFDTTGWEDVMPWEVIVQ